MMTSGLAAVYACCEHCESASGDLPCGQDDHRDPCGIAECPAARPLH